MIWALQNDHQNLSFAKDNDLLGNKMIINSHKNGQSVACHFHFETLFTKVRTHSISGLKALLLQKEIRWFQLYSYSQA